MLQAVWAKARDVVSKMRTTGGRRERAAFLGNIAALAESIKTRWARKGDALSGPSFLRFFRDLKTGHKIMALIIVMAAFMSSVGLAGYYYTGKMSQLVRQIAAGNVLSVKWLNEIRVATGATEAAITRLVNPLTIDKFFIDEKIAEIKKRDESIAKLLADYRQLELSPFEKERIAALEFELGSYRTEVQKVVALTVTERKPAAYAAFTQEAKPHLDAANALLMELADYSSRQAEETSALSQREAAVAQAAVLAAALLAIVLAVLLGFLLSRFTARRLAAVGTALNEVAQGNLQFNALQIAANDDIGAIAQDVNKMAANLRAIVSHVAQAAEHVAASSEELTANAGQSSQSVDQVAAVTGEVADSAHKQRAAVDQTSAAIGQVTAKLQQIAANAAKLAAVADESAVAAQAGNAAVGEAVTQILTIEKTVAQTAEVVGKLGERSKNIGSIVSTIAQIAGQTNLLSLNAAIEAARAGEQGRGFAVVAEEVRKLADQSQQATKQIAALLAEIRADADKAVEAMVIGTREVRLGAEVVDVAGGSFRTIAALVQEVSSQVREISLDIQETAHESHVIVDAVASIETSSRNIAGQMLTVSAATEEQAAATEEITASSRNLAQMAAELQQAIRLFKM